MALFFYPSMLEARALATRFPCALGALPAAKAPPRGLAEIGAPPLEVWREIRALLARFGRRPSHPLRPGGERAWRAARAGRLRSIDGAVDAGNAAALRCGLPVATVDLERLTGPLRIAALPRGARMIVGPDGATVDVGGLPAAVDDAGPYATPVAVAAAARTTAATRSTLSIVWGATSQLGAIEAALAHLREQMAALGGACEERAVTGPAGDPVGRALLDAILDDPGGDPTRLVFADWLEAHGGAAALRRARFIRDGLAGAIDSPGSALLEAVAEDIGVGPGWVRWERGFARELHLDGTDDAGRLRRVRDEPIEAVWARTGAALALPATTRELALWSPAIGPLAHPAPHRLRRLQLSGAPDDAGWAWLATLPAIEWLVMHIPDGAPWHLPGPSSWRSLATLRLMGGRFTPETAAAAPTAGLTALELKWCQLDDALVARLPRAPALASLTLAKDPITTLAPFERAPLRELSLWDLPLGRAEADRILAMASLEVLHVSDCPAIAQPLQDAIDRGALPALRELYGLYAWSRELEHGGRRPPPRAP